MAEVNEFTAKGLSGSLVVTPTHVYIVRAGLGSMFVPGGKTDRRGIPIDAITAVHYKSPGLLSAGSIYFSYGGHTDSRWGLGDPSAKDNLITFGRRQQPNFETAYDLIEQYRQEARRPATPATASQQTILDQIKQLGELRDGGVITDDEFQMKKRDLLSRL